MRTKTVSDRPCRPEASGPNPHETFLKWDSNTQKRLPRHGHVSRWPMRAPHMQLCCNGVTIQKSPVRPLYLCRPPVVQHPHAQLCCSGTSVAHVQINRGNLGDALTQKPRSLRHTSTLWRISAFTGLSEGS